MQSKTAVSNKVAEDSFGCKLESVSKSDLTVTQHAELLLQIIVIKGILPLRK